MDWGSPVTILSQCLKIVYVGAKEMAQWVNCFQRKYENLSLDLRHPSESHLWGHTSVTPILGVPRDRQLPSTCWPASRLPQVQ